MGGGVGVWCVVRRIWCFMVRIVCCVIVFPNLYPLLLPPVSLYFPLLPSPSLSRYYIFGNTTKSNILENFEEGQPGPAGGIEVTIARACVALCIFFSYPIPNFVGRQVGFLLGFLLSFTLSFHIELYAE